MVARPFAGLRAGVAALSLLVLTLLPQSPALAFDIPELTRPIVDPAGTLDAGERARLEQRLVELQRRGVFQMAIFLPRSLEGADIESYSMAVAEKWRLGKKGEDRGLLLVLAMAERRMRLEVGYGLEGDIPDAIARRILDETLRPRLREGNPELGLEETVTRLGRIATGDRTALPDSGASRGRFVIRPNSIGGFAVVFLIVLVFFGLVALSVLGAFLNAVRPGSRYPTRRSRGGWHSGGWSGGGGFGSGGGFSGGGGGFGGGGASSNW